MGQGRQPSFSRSDLAAALVKQPGSAAYGMNALAVRGILDAALGIMVDRITSGERVTLDNFGSFIKKRGQQREEGVEHFRVIFKPSGMLKRTINERP